MLDTSKTLGEILSDPRLAPIAKDAIRDLDLSREGMWNKSIAQLREEHFGGNLEAGLTRLLQAAETDAWYFELSRHGEENTFLTYLPSQDKAADDRPYILLVPGGGFVNVWNLTEGWPVAAQYNALGYHVFILTYQVRGGNILQREMDDFAEAIRFIRAHASDFHVQPDRYLTCGFSAGGYLVCLWNTRKGYRAYDLPSPRAVFPVYPVTSWKLRKGGFAPDSALRLFGTGIEEACESDFEIPEHVEGFPPCALFLAAQDDLVPPDHSRLLADALEREGIPCRLEIGPEGGHGFADGTGMCMAGWTERAIRFYEGLEKA